MKTHLLLITLFISSFVSAQEYCAYDVQTSINFGLTSDDDPFQILELPNDQYLILGTSYNINTNVFKAIVCRMNADDTIDLSFGVNGRVSYTWDSRNTCVSAALQEDGKILIGGYQAPGNSGSSFRAYIARLNADGSIDESFGDFGSTLFTNLPGLTVGMKQMENGKIQVAAVCGNPRGLALYQLNEDGSIDEGFGTDGLILHTYSEVFWAAEDSKAFFMNDGSIVYVTETFSNNSYKAFVGKLNASGELDSGFGTDGSLIIELPIQQAFAGIHAALDAEENIYVGTTSEGTPKKFQLAKVSGVTGTLMTEFGDEGFAFSTNSDEFNTLRGLSVDPSNGDVYVVGKSTSSGSSIWKLDSLGEEIDQCGGDAMFTYPFPFTNGLKVAYFLSNGNMKLVGISGSIDETSEDVSQGANFYVPLSSTSGLNEIEHSDLTIYPNPVMDNLNIQTADDLKIESYKIRNQLGQIIQYANQSNKTIQTAQLTPGIYFLEVSSSKGVAIRKFIKQ